MFKKLSLQSVYYDFIQRGIIIVIVFLVSFYSYTLFHSLAEIISIVIGFGVYMVTWNSRNLIANKYFVFLGMAFFYIAAFDLMHVFTYKGFGVFTHLSGENLADQFWLAARYLQGFSFLAAAFFIGKNLKALRVFYFYVFVSLALIISILWLPLFPEAYRQGYGLTPFKNVSEIIVCLLFIFAGIVLWNKRGYFNVRVFNLLLWAISFSLISELAILFYVGPYDHYNIIAHLLKMAAFNLIYIAFIEIGLRKPYALLFKELKDSEMNYRRSEQKFKTIFNNATVGILMTDLNGRIIEMNHRFLSESGYTRSELIGLELAEHNHLANNILDKLEFKAIKDGHLEYFTFENLYIKKNGDALWGDTSVSLIMDEDHKPKHILWLIQNITQTKEMEQVKIEFISLASHQLRTHLSSVRLATELLLRGLGGNLESRQNRYLQEIYTSTRRMSAMIKDLLNVSRVELGTFIVKRERIDLVANIDKIADELSLQLQAKNVVLRRDYDGTLPLMQFDVQILRIIFENLLANAISYTPVGGIIGIKVRRDNSEIIIAISDNGCGIPEPEQDKIFTKQFRASNAKVINPGGSGLGLYIVKAVVLKIKARVWFESKEGEGTTFYVALPSNDINLVSKQGRLL